jgi:hypothetical protein
MLPAPAQLEIGCTKPRAYGDAMGIESVGQGCKGLWVATGMEGADRCLLLNADLLRACGAWSEEMGGRGGESGRCTRSRGFSLAHVSAAAA